MNEKTVTKLDRQVRFLRAPPPWQAFVVPVSGFPIPERECAQLSELVGRISALATTQWRLSSEVFLELEQMKGLECRHCFSDHGREWLPEVGLGVWPDRDRPALFTREEFENWAPGTPMRELLCEVFRISTSPQQRMGARDAMLTFGPVVEILMPESNKAFFANINSVYLDFIESRAHRCFPYYIPLLEGKTVESLSADQLNHWCPGVSVYLRESFQDRGVLIASPLPITDLLEELLGKVEARSRV
jgi:hypothetical protein